MTKTFTKSLDINEINLKKEEKIPFFTVSEPSKNVIQNILNFSKNLEVRHSKLIPPIELIKS